MKEDIDIEPLTDLIELRVMPLWVFKKDQKKEFLAAGKAFDSTVVEDLDKILELFYEKKYREGLEAYLQWILDVGYPINYDDAEIVLKYGKHFTINAANIEKLCDAIKKYDAEHPEK